jgi:hypothetical protein
MKLLESLVKRSVSVSENENNKSEVVSMKELQLSEEVVKYQGKISQLESNFKQITKLIENGDFTEKSLLGALKSNSTTATTSLFTKNKDIKIDEKKEKEIESLIDKKLNLKENQKKSTNNPIVKNLNDEVKFLSVKLEEVQKKLSDSETKLKNLGYGSGGGGGNNTTDKVEEVKVEEVKVEEVKVEEVSLESTNDGPPPMMGDDGPPPPPGMGDGPPPPPGFGDGPPPPPGMGDGPPPPMMMGMGMTKKTNLPTLPSKKAKVPMKTIFWSKLPPKSLEGSIWLEKGLVKDLENVRINYEELEQMFTAKKKEEVKKDEKPVIQKVSLVDPKKGNNAAIVLGSLRLKNEELLKAIYEIKDNVLKNENLKSLYDLTPTPEESQQIDDYVKEGKDVELLGTCEKYFMVIKVIPRLPERLNCWMFKNNFSQMLSTIQPDINNTLSTINDLLDSDGLVQLLQIILAIGNYLNSTKVNSSVHGFQMASLLKLKDHKSGNGTNLLQYIYEYILR